MPNPTLIRLLSAAGLLTLSALAVAQQTPAPEPSPPEKPPMQKPATPPSPEAKSTHPLMGLTAVSSDGSNVGDVRAVKTTPDGKVTGLHIHSGGFLGFGGKIVEISEGNFSQTGDKVRLTLTAEQVGKLPAVKDQR
jgi:PRC-barrel domain